MHDGATHTPASLPVVTAAGRWALMLATEVGASVRLLATVLPAVGQMRLGDLVAQAHRLANRSLFFVGLTMAFSGAILVVQASLQARTMIGDLSAVGPAFLQLLVRQYGPAVVALMVAARCGAGSAAEIGTMTITEQVDALRVAGASPTVYLVAPRVLGGLIGMLPVVIFGVAVAFVTGAVVGNVRFGIGWDSFFSHRMVSHGDVITGVVKALAFGITVPLWACRAGLRARGGAPGVGNATTRAVIGASVAVLFLDLLIGTVGYVVFDVLDVLGAER